MMENAMKRILIPLFFVLVACSFSLAYGEDVHSLRGDADVTDDSVPAASIDWKPPGAVVPRTSAHQPPLIAHDITGMKITNTYNPCLGCHGVEGTGAPKPFQTHYTDRDGNKGEDISRRWYFCTQCHVGQVDAKPLVENTFEGK
ncbi:MAG: nitrate reductase cytochrome c-type subunit; periplasmic nitrate reductase electron transfer subunit [Candidatus Electrothrix sp. AUS4]|nr:nitrate reductase cytochrome c-type subunit; periplasmic nitrate reductase electron transfer subunit [Candidatus Electrothrix sp. AUS4]